MPTRWSATAIDSCARVFTAAGAGLRGAGAIRHESLAARFAAKEATSKALGAPRGIGWHDVEVVPARPGEREPRLVLRGRAPRSPSPRDGDVLVSMTHAAGVAAAVAIAVG